MGVDVPVTGLSGRRLLLTLKTDYLVWERKRSGQIWEIFWRTSLTLEIIVGFLPSTLTTIEA